MRRVLFLVLALLAGCGAPDPATRWRREWTDAQEVKLDGGIVLLQQAGLRRYADHIQALQYAGRFHAAEGWRADGLGWDACYVVGSDTILVEPRAVDRYDAWEVGAVLLGEAIHRDTGGGDRDHAVYREMMAIYGRAR
jgi:hypothetical protein